MALALYAVAWLLVVGVSLCTAETYHLSPQGSNEANGRSPDTAWRTFPYAIPRLQPGDTLVLANGTYTARTTGLPRIICGGGARSGQAGSPITIKAAQERQALIHGEGDTALHLQFCAHWTIQGLVLRSHDDPLRSGAVVHLEDAAGLTLQRNVVHHANRFQNVPLVLLVSVSHSLMEENELYWFHRNGMSTKHGSHNTFRRNYFNSRGYGDISGGNDSGTQARGDCALTIYPGSYHVLENNLSEGNAAAWDIQAIGPSQGNRILGHISLRDNYGGILHARGNTLTTMPVQTTIEHFAVIEPAQTGLYARSSKDTRCINCSVFGGQRGLSADMEALRGDGYGSFEAVNALVVGNREVGVFVVEQTAWSIDYTNAYGTGQPFVPMGPQVTHARSLDPQMGHCRLWIPDGSPMKRAGRGGADIGASIVTRYQNGQLTPVPLWGPGFPCGAVVPGVNDVAGASCADVHLRLGVGAEGCVPPVSGGAPIPWAALPPPRNLRLQR